ncbi:hypothetical protein G6F68_013345 [Rhizopus microsporus]|nr:hypothetical protein G6F68_013345 [Rhizopus microsporus]
MRAAGGQAQHDVARLDGLAVDDRGLFHRTHRKTGQVVFAVRVHARHFSGFAADQRAAGLGAAVGDAAHDRRGGVDVQLAGGEIVQEEQRLGALHQHVVHAHGDQVDADRIVAVQLVGQLQLGAHAGGTRHQHRLAVLVGQVEQGAEATQAAHHFRAEAALDQGLDPLDQLVAGVDVDTRVTVGEGGGGGRRGVGHGRRRWQGLNGRF